MTRSDTRRRTTNRVLTMSVLWTLLILARDGRRSLLSSIVLLGRAACWILAGLYLLAAAALVPASAAVLTGADREAPHQFSIPWARNGRSIFALRADGIGIVFAMIALVIGAVVLAYSARYLERGRQLSFSLVMALFTLSMVRLVLADDLVLLFI